MLKIAALYGIATGIFFAIDMAWLGFFAKNFYKEKLGFIFTGQVRWAPAVIFYLIYIAGILFFAVLPALREQSWATALISGAFLGALCYATYDLTNMATITQWPLVVVIVDIVWGVFITGGVAVATYFIGTKIM
jgi:uncharacterized membrane protein